MDRVTSAMNTVSRDHKHEVCPAPSHSSCISSTPLASSPAAPLTSGDWVASNPGPDTLHGTFNDLGTASAKRIRYASNKQYSARIHPLFSVVSSLFVVLLLLVACSGSAEPAPGNTNNSQSQSTSLQALSAPMVAGTVPIETPGEATPTTPALTPTSPTSIPTTTSLPDNHTPIAATREAYENEVAANLEALKTSVALTHAPTEMPGPPSPVVSPTPMLGILPGCSNTNAYEPQVISCWRGVVDGQLVDVGAGREGRSGDMAQGILKIYVQGQEDVDIYNTPNLVGPVRLVSVSDRLFTLSTVDLATPQIFVFDLDTRQWVSP